MTFAQNFIIFTKMCYQNKQTSQAKLANIDVHQSTLFYNLNHFKTDKYFKKENKLTYGRSIEAMTRYIGKFNSENSIPEQLTACKYSNTSLPGKTCFII